ncbi:MAG: RHS repeat-associated core domain-containing protein [Burkholderiales bacterium]
MKEVRTLSGGTLAGTRTTWNLHPDNAGGLGYEMEVNAPSPATTANPAVTSHRHFLSVGGQAIGVLVSTGSLPTLTATQTSPAILSSITVVKVEYWHKDHLGSLAATTDHAGNVTARYAYDPFGKRRYASGVYDANGNVVVDWSAAVNSGTDRGYTGHEHLDDVGIVHMNGRLFDPTLGIFLQGDPFIQSPDDLQNYNRYGYCLNNPLTCTDPTGFWGLKSLIQAPFRIAKEMTDWELRTVKKAWRNPVIKAVVIAVASYYTAGWASEFYASAMAAEAGFAAGASIEGIEAAMTVAYSAAESSVIGGAIAGAAGGFTGGTLASNGRLKAGVNGAMSGAISGGVNNAFGVNYPAQRIVANAGASGVAAAINGGDFSKGFRQGAMISSLTYLNVQMREEMKTQSMLNVRTDGTELISQSPEFSRNDGTGLSKGLFGDLFKLAGGRFDPDYSLATTCSPMGCNQNGSGSYRIFGITRNYQRGGFEDMILESFAGPHDKANSPWFYNPENGDIRMGMSQLERKFKDVTTNYSTSLIFAAPFAGAAIYEQTYGSSSRKPK